MATFNYAIDRQIASSDESVIIVSWLAMAANADVGAPVCFAAWSDKTYIVDGTFTGAPTVIIEGSNDGVNWSQLTNRQGTALSWTAAGLNTSQDRPAFIRPRLTAGAGGASVNVRVACHRTDIQAKGY